MRTRKWWSLSLAAAGIATAAWGQPPGTPTPEEVSALREQVETLTRQLNQFEARYAADKDTIVEKVDAVQAKAADTKEKQPVVTLDGNGLKVKSEDGAFESRIRVRLGHDWAWFGQDEELRRAVGEEQDGTDFRFARIQLQGKVWEDFNYTAEFDFAGQAGEDSPKFRDVFVQYNGIPYGGDRGFDVRVGHFKEPFSLDEQNAITAWQFLENPLLDVFVPSRNAGIQFSDALLGEPKAERLTWAIGAFKETDDLPSSNDSDEDQGYQITGRVTGLPIYADKGRKLLHLGAAFSHRNPDGARVNYGTRPESRVALFRYVDPDAFPAGFRFRDTVADNINLYGLELAGIFGPLSFQSEYVRSDVETELGGDLTFDGYYLQAGYFLTGENRTYRHDGARIENPVVKHPFKLRGEERGWGAWEVAARYGAVDISDGPVRGGEHSSVTLGVNWFLNQNVKISTNYIHNEIDHDLYEGDFDVLQTRFQFEF
jgi:phosphate-selective porin OprO/OprP